MQDLHGQFIKEIFYGTLKNNDKFKIIYYFVDFAT